MTVMADTQCMDTHSITTAVTTAEALVSRIATVTGDDWTFGYIGNCDATHDDRAWFAFRRVPGHVGTSADRIGGHSTENLDQLVCALTGALKMARMLTDNPVTR